MKVYEFVVRDYKKEKAKKVLNEAKTTMTTLTQLLIKIDPDSKGILTPTILETIDMWLSWWERDALAHLRWVQKKGLDSAAAMGRLHQIQEIRIGLTVDKEKFDAYLKAIMEELNNSKQFEDDSNVPELEAEKRIIEKK